MKKIFTCKQFAPDKDKDSFSDVTPEEYLKGMLSCIDGGELCIAKEADDVSINLAQNLSSANYIVQYTLDISKVGAAVIIAKEQAFFAVCREIAYNKEGKEKALAALQTVVGENTDAQGIRAANVLRRAQRLEKLLELGASDFVVRSERCYLIEEIALNEFAVKSAVIEKNNFQQAFGIG